MKPLSILFFICHLFLFGACSNPEIELELIEKPYIPKKIEKIEFVTSEEQETPQDAIPEQNLTVTTPVSPAIEDVVTDLPNDEAPITPPTTEEPLEDPVEDPTLQPSQPSTTLYLENGAGRDYYETIPYLSPKEEIIVNDGEMDYGMVMYDHYKIIEDMNESGRKGIAFFYTETNISDEPIEVGLAGRVMNPIVNSSVFYGEDELKRMPADAQSLEFADEDYLQSLHVEYTKKQAKVESCASPTTLKPGKSRICYNHYSYAGEGEYLINQAIDNTYSNYESFVVEVK